MSDSSLQEYRDVCFQGNPYDLKWGLKCGSYHLFVDQSGLRFQQQSREAINIPRNWIRQYCQDRVAKVKYLTIFIGNAPGKGAGELYLISNDVEELKRFITTRMKPQKSQRPSAKQPHPFSQRINNVGKSKPSFIKAMMKGLSLARSKPRQPQVFQAFHSEPSVGGGHYDLPNESNRSDDNYDLNTYDNHDDDYDAPLDPGHDQSEEEEGNDNDLDDDDAEEDDLEEESDENDDKWKPHIRKWHSQKQVSTEYNAGCTIEVSQQSPTSVLVNDNALYSLSKKDNHH